MAHAVIQTGGKQYLVSEGDTIRVEKLAGNAGDSIQLADVLLLADDKNVSVGQPVVNGASVTAEIVKQGRSRKIDVVKFKSKVRYRRKAGHRQEFTDLKVTAIKA